MEVQSVDAPEQDHDLEIRFSGGSDIVSGEFHTLRVSVHRKPFDAPGRGRRRGCHCSGLSEVQTAELYFLNVREYVEDGLEILQVNDRQDFPATSYCDFVHVRHNIGACR